MLEQQGRPIVLTVFLSAPQSPPLTHFLKNLTNLYAFFKFQLRWHVSPEAIWTRSCLHVLPGFDSTTVYSIPLPNFSSVSSAIPISVGSWRTESMSWWFFVPIPNPVPKNNQTIHQHLWNWAKFFLELLTKCPWLMCCFQVRLHFHKRTSWCLWHADSVRGGDLL